MDQNYRTMYFNYENADARLEFYTCSEDHIPEEVKAELEHGPLTCKPRFIIFLVSIPPVSFF